MTMMTLVLACTTAAVDDGIVTLSGWVYDDPFVTDRSEVISSTVASIDVLDTLGEPLVVDGQALNSGIEPFDAYPGYWRWWAIPDAPYFLRIDGGEGYHPALWSGWGPPDNGILQGLVFGFEDEDTDAWFAAISEATGLPIDTEGDRVHLWGHFDEGYCSTDSEGLAPDCPTINDITIRSGPADGHVNVVLGFTVQEDGTMAQTQVDPVRYFYAFNMEPDFPVDVYVVRDEDEVVQTYGPGPRDIIAAWYFQGP